MKNLIDVNVTKMVSHLEEMRKDINHKYSNIAHMGNDVLMIKAVNKSQSIFDFPIRVDAITIVRPKLNEVKFNIDLKECVADKNSVICILPQAIYSEMNFSESNSDLIFINKDFLASNSVDVSFREIVPIMLKMAQTPVLAISEGAAKEIDMTIDLLFSTLNSDSEYKKIIVRSLLVSIMARIVGEFSKKISSAEETPMSKSRKDIYFKQFMMLVTEHYKVERSVGFYADKMHITPKYLSGLIKQVSGKSAAEWIDHYVVLEAKNLIKYSGLNIQEIAYSLNFPNQSFFGKFFKRLSGMSPSEYKNL